MLQIAEPKIQDHNVRYTENCAAELRGSEELDLYTANRNLVFLAPQFEHAKL